MNGITLRIAGNTEAPCFWAIRSKGYEIEMYCNLTNIEASDCLWTYEATKGDNLFSATSIQELLGLIAMWEVRGNSWRVTEEEINEYIDIKDKAPLYDINGNEIIE